jgi:hypothetical protein
MTWRTDSAQLIAGRWITSLYDGHGVQGSVVLALADGAQGPPFGRADLESPADDTAEVRWQILRWPAAGTLTPQENSSFVFSGAPPGRYFFDVEGFRNGASRGTKRVILLIGPQLTLIEQLHSELNTLASGSSWYSVNDAQASSNEDPYPFIVVQRVGNEPNNTMDGMSELQNTRIQIDIHARTILQADDIRRQVEEAMEVWTLQNVPLSSLDLFDEAARVHRVVLDYSVWSVR